MGHPFDYTTKSCFKSLQYEEKSFNPSRTCGLRSGLFLRQLLSTPHRNFFVDVHYRQRGRKRTVIDYANNCLDSSSHRHADALDSPDPCPERLSLHPLTEPICQLSVHLLGYDSVRSKTKATDFRRFQQFLGKAQDVYAGGELNLRLVIPKFMLSTSQYEEKQLNRVDRRGRVVCVPFLLFGTYHQPPLRNFTGPVHHRRTARNSTAIDNSIKLLRPAFSSTGGCL